MMQRRSLLAAGMLSAPGLALAQSDWPSRPVRIIVTFPPGGTTDILARLMAERYARATGGTFVVENRAGAGGMIGADLVAKAAPDGTTLLLTTSGPHGSGPALYPNMPFDPMGDFTHIALIASPPNVFAVRPDSRLRSVPDVVAAARATPGLTYASPGNGTLNHLNGALLALSAGVTLQHVPYRGAAPAQTALMAGEVATMFDSISSSAPHLRDGRMRALAISGPERIPAFPDIPTFVEQGFPEVVVLSWFGLSAPRGLAPALARRLNELTLRILAEPEMAQRMIELGSAPNRMDQAAFTAFVEAEIAKWRRVVATAGIRLD
jgi:tripartite-type tricarboxylate transporter receptor subunit TctC